MQIRSRSLKRRLLLATATAAWLATSAGNATDIQVFNAGLDNPTINALLRPAGGGDPFSGPDGEGGTTFNIFGFLDTGATGVLLSKETATALGVGTVPGVTFEDVGIGGSSTFNISVPLRVDLAPVHPSVDINDANQYTQRFDSIRAQVNPNDALIPLDVFGMPVMQHKVVVIDPKPLNNFDINNPSFDSLHTFIYNPGTPATPANMANPGIPQTNRQVALTFASFSRFTRLTPENSPEAPSQSANPFIGPNPLAKVDPNVPAGSTPGITIKLGNKETTGSFLLDTGAQSSIISKDLAKQLGVRERAPQSPGDAPVLEQFDPAHPELPGTELPDQFITTLTGTGGEQTAAGFYLDSLLVRTKQGDAGNENDPRHLRYVHAPVLVADISLLDPKTLQSLTLDGVFGMNFLVASALIPDPTTLFPEGILNSPYQWIVFDAENGVLGLDLAVVPEPHVTAFMLLGSMLIAWRARALSGGAHRTHAKSVP